MNVDRVIRHHCLTKSTIIAYILYNESKLLNIIYTFSVASNK